METTPKKTKTNTRKTNTTGEELVETPLVRPLSKKHLSAVETYQALEDNLTLEEKNSKIPLIIAFLSALALIVGLSIFLSQVSHYSWDSSDLSADKKQNDTTVCDDSTWLVCGVNGLTYKNACIAESAKIIIEHDGECLTPTNEVSLSVLTGSDLQSWAITTTSSSGDILSGSINPAYLSDDNEISSPVTDNINVSENSIVWVASGVTSMDHASNANIVPANTVVLNMNSYVLDPKTKIATYNKKEYNYSYSFPAAVFFQWFIAPKWVTHEIVLKSSAPPTSRMDWDVVVDFYRWKLLNELQWTAAILVDSRYYIAKWDSTFVLEDLTKTNQSKKIIDTIIATLNY